MRGSAIEAVLYMAIYNTEVYLFSIEFECLFSLFEIVLIILLNFNSSVICSFERPYLSLRQLNKKRS